MENQRNDPYMKKVEKYIQNNKLLYPEDSVLIGVSGGADSIALLDMLNKWKGVYLKNIYAVHIHHGIRGKEADRDAAYVEKFCENRKIKCKIVHKDVRKYAKDHKTGEEEAGRILRYEEFEKIRKELLKKGEKSVKIGIAHHGDDLAETILHHIVRGTGLRGMAGIRPVQGNLIRPLLCLERVEIEEYLKINNISYVTDSTNLSDDYTRNRIRHQVLGTLKEQINIQSVSHMRELAELSSQADAYLEEAANEKMISFTEWNKQENEVLIKDAFFQEKEILVQYGIRQVLEKLARKRKDISGNHIHSVMELSTKQVGRILLLPYQIKACKTYEGILFRKEQNLGHRVENNSMSLINEEIIIPGKMQFESFFLETKTFSYQGQKIPEKKYTKWFDYDKIKNGLCIRQRMLGDYLIVDQNGSKKKLNRYFIDEKIPAEKRQNYLLIADGQEIFWVIGGRISESGKIQEDTRRILEIKYKGEDDNE